MLTITDPQPSRNNVYYWEAAPKNTHANNNALSNLVQDAKKVYDFGRDHRSLIENGIKVGERFAKYIERDFEPVWQEIPAWVKFGFSILEEF